MSALDTKYKKARARALARGKPTYKGAPCKRNHTGTRFTSGAGCVDCIRAQVRKWRRAHPERYRELGRHFYLSNLRRARQLGKQWYLDNLKRKNEQSRQWRIKNPERNRAYNITHLNIA